MLTIRNLSKTYANGVQALSDVSLEIPRGMFGLLGPNGAGKSTLMRTLATLQEADSGTATLEVDGAEDGSAGKTRTIDVLRQKEELRKVLGYLPQEFGVYPRISAETLLDHFAVLKGIGNGRERKETVAALLHQTNLWEVRKRRLSTFSGGMRQRFGIAQALLGNPRLLIVDEPTAGLDPQERNRFLNLLSEVGENVVVILSTRSPQEILAGLHGTIWEKAIDKGELADYQSRYEVISSRLFAGRPLLHVYSAAPPGDGFAPVAADLEDVYFHTLRRAAAPAARAAA